MGEKMLSNRLLRKMGNSVEGYVPRNIKNGSLIAINSKKAVDFFHSTGLQLPEGKGITTLNDNIIDLSK